MRVHGYSFTYHDGIPTPVFPTEIAAYAPAVKEFVHGSDTVRIRAFDEYPSIVGRVLDVANSVDDVPEGDAMHPLLQDSEFMEQKFNKFIKLQLFIPADDECISSCFAPPPVSMRRACGQMEEVAPTNLIIWVSSLQICSFVYFILQEDCVNQVWGPVYERMNTYSIRYYAIFEYEEEGDDPWAFTIVMDNISLSPVVYHTVIDKSPDGAPATATERRLEWFLQVSSYAKELVIKGAKLKNQLSKKMFMSRENMEWLVDQMGQMTCDDESDDKGYFGGIFCKSFNTRSRQNISHPNFSLQTELLKTRKTVIRVVSSEGFDKVSMIFHGGFGNGIRKKFPSLIERTNNTKNPVHLKNGDVVNVLNCPLHDYHSHDTSDWFDRDAASYNLPLNKGSFLDSGRNFLRWVYNNRERTCNFTIKCTPINVGKCTAPIITSLLDQVKANWNVGSDPRLPVGTNIEIDYDVWVVQSVDGDDVLLYNSATEETSQHAIEYCLENVMGN